MNDLGQQKSIRKDDFPMFVHPKKEIKLKDVAYIMLSMDESNGYSIDNLLFDRYDLMCYQIPVTPKLRDLLEDYVRLLVTNTLDHWSSLLRIDELMSDEALGEMMERNFDRLFQQPNLDVIAIETRATLQLRDEMEEAARSFILNYYYQLPDEDRENYFNQYTDDTTLTVYYHTFEEQFKFTFPGESYPGDHIDRFPCGEVIVSSEDIDEIFG